MKVANSIFLAVVWIGGIAVGSWSMVRYESTPAEVQAVIECWPVSSALKRDPLRPTLLMFVHPKCPCSRASVGELSELVARAGDRLSATVIFLRPAGFGPDWEKTDLWRAAESIPNATVICDVDGVETGRFRAAASGETLVYQPDGRLLFHGGLTPARGHRGESAGRTSIERLVDGDSMICDRTAVYGCALVNRNSIPPADSSLLPQDR